MFLVYRDDAGYERSQMDAGVDPVFNLNFRYRNFLATLPFCRAQETPRQT